MAASAKRRHFEIAEDEDYKPSTNGVKEHQRNSLAQSPVQVAEDTFAVEYPTLQKNGRRKRKRPTPDGEPGSLQEEPAPFGRPDLKITYTVRPWNRWESMKKYKNFVLTDETFGVGDYIFVNNSEIKPGDGPSETDEHAYWVGKVLEVRALDQAHVYLRVFWLYWPHELPGGARDYHGKSELVASNYMDIIDAMSVNGKAPVSQWEEKDEEELLEGLYWRQTFNFATNTLSEVRKHCVCNKHYNPDKTLIGCSNPSCRIWLHEECLLEDALERTYKKYVDDTPKKRKRRKGSARFSATPNKKSMAQPWDGLFEAKIDAKGVDDSAGTITITDLRGDEPRSWKEDIVCLSCHQKIK